MQSTVDVELEDEGNEEKFRVVPMHHGIHAPLEPLDCYAALCGGSKHSFLLESVERESFSARYSFLGVNPVAVLRSNGKDLRVEALDPRADVITDIVTELPGGFSGLAALARRLDYLPALSFDRQVLLGGLVGNLAYDLAFHVNPAFHDTPPVRNDVFCFGLYLDVVLFDHFREEAYAVSNALVPPGRETRYPLRVARERADSLAKQVEGADRRKDLPWEPIDVRPAHDRRSFEGAVCRARQHIVDGDIFQVVLSRRREAEFRGDVLSLYGRLRAINPSPYTFMMCTGDDALIGASPETLVSVHGDTVSVNPIAGTRGRGSTPEQDRALAEEMLADPKEQAEHVMLVDLGRNDLARVCVPGTVKVEDYMSVLRFSHVQHIDSKVRGQLRRGMDAFDAIAATFPAGTVSGAPKVRAMELIEELESMPRGPYAGGVGYVSFSGDADFAICIRTLHLHEQRLTVQAGAGIVADSDPSREYVETENKMQAMLAALGGGGA